MRIAPRALPAAKRSTGRDDPHTHSHADGYRYILPFADSDRGHDPDSDTDGHRHQHADCYADLYCLPNLYAHAYGYADTPSHPHWFANPERDAQRYGDGDMHPDTAAHYHATPKPIVPARCDPTADLAADIQLLDNPLTLSARVALRFGEACLSHPALKCPSHHSISPRVRTVG